MTYDTRTRSNGTLTGGDLEFHSLPDDVIFRIFSFLTPREVLNASLVSKHICGVALEPYLWKKFCKNKYGSQMNTTKYSATSSNRWMTMYKEQNGWKPANFANPQTFAAYRDWHRIDRMLLNDDLLFTFCLSHAQPIRVWDLKKTPKPANKAASPILELPEAITQVCLDRSQIFCLGKGEIQIRERANVLRNVHSIKWDLLTFENPQLTDDLFFVSVDNRPSKSIQIRDRRRIDSKIAEISTDYSWSTFKVLNNNLLVVAQLGRAFGMFLYDTRTNQVSSQ